MTTGSARGEEGEGGVPQRPRLSIRGGAAVAVGGALGALLRHGVSVLVSGPSAVLPVHPFPWGTLVANALGAFLLGIVDGCLKGSSASPSLRLFWATGVCGGFTTFSLFSSEVLVLLQSGRGLAAAAYAVASLALAVGGIAAGVTAVRASAPGP